MERQNQDNPTSSPEVKHVGMEYVVGVLVLGLVLAISGNFMIALIAQTTACFVLGLVWKRSVVVLSVYAGTLLFVVAIWRATVVIVASLGVR